MDLSPKQIVNKLDKYIIGQDEAKKAVAIALRNRYRRAQLPDEIREEWKKKIPLRRGGQVEDIANVATFLASDLSSYVTGQVIQVDGGMNM